MTRSRAFLTWSVLLIVGLVLGLGGGAWASHRWGCWKYADGAIEWYNGATGDYWTYFEDEARDDPDSWWRYSTVGLRPVTSSGTTDHLNAFNGFYGFNGWLGLAQIVRSSGCTILEGRAYLNMTYLESGSYSTTNKKHVACQEVGHLFGLEHNRNATDTCMNDTILNAPFPNSHDSHLVNSIYPCNGTSGTWQGCRGTGCSVCSELVDDYQLYFKNHPSCAPNDNCGGLYFTCNEDCPAPTSADRCDGTPGTWQGCRGTGCFVCEELVEDYPCYFRNHPYCEPNDNCGGLYFTCNQNCPAPTQADKC